MSKTEISEINQAVIRYPGLKSTVNLAKTAEITLVLHKAVFTKSGVVRQHQWLIVDYYGKKVWRTNQELTHFIKHLSKYKYKPQNNEQ